MRSHVQPDDLVVDLSSIGRAHLALVGAKAANLGELIRAAVVTVPAGFCVTTAAFRRAVTAGHHTAVPDRMPEAVAAEIRSALAQLGDGTALAVRSSATTEDSATTSFAGLHDSFLGVIGSDAVLAHVVRCWASLSSDRAVAYRQRHGVPVGTGAMAVIVQRMVDPSAAGVLFTADPVSGHRAISSIEAIAGLGEVLALGHTSPEVVKVRDGRVVERHEALGRHDHVVTDAEAILLADVGRRIEAHLGAPQDIEWCLVGDPGAARAVHVVQSRPITTLFPVPAVDDGSPHVYLSVGHQQMMTDAMRPLGLSLWQRLAMAPMREAGGRLFVDVAPRLAVPSIRATLLELFGRSDPLTRDALQTVIDRGDLIERRLDDDTTGPRPGSAPASVTRAAPTAAPPPVDGAVVAALIRQNEASVAALARDLEGCTGAAVIDRVAADVPELQRLLTDPISLRAINAGMEATWWLEDHLAEWLGDDGAGDERGVVARAVDVLAQSAPGNVTSEMGLALLDVADAIRPHPEVVMFLRGIGDDDSFLDALPQLPGGCAAREAMLIYLDRYGARCVGEIDITRPRWAERPSTLVAAILADVDRFEEGEARRRVEAGAARAAAMERELLERLRQRPGGAQAADQVRQMIDRLRTFVGYREYPKFGIVRRLAIWKRALMEEADRLVAAGVIDDREDVHFLRFDELGEVVRTRWADRALIVRRRAEHAVHRALTAPRVLTSDGEVITGSYHRDDSPPGALVGLGVSAGTIEGRARVVVDLSAGVLEPGDILVTAFTDPGWSPLFVSAAGLVTEVGGAMTHGSVIAREYGLPAVVGVDGATRSIRDGQRLRLDGSNGWVELLDG